MSERLNPAADLNVERLARMASVDGSWWQETDRQARRPRTLRRYRRHALIGALLGLAIGGAGIAFQVLS